MHGVQSRSQPPMLACKDGKQCEKRKECTPGVLVRALPPRASASQPLVAAAERAPLRLESWQSTRPKLPASPASANAAQQLARSGDPVSTSASDPVDPARIRTSLQEVCL